jgi:glycosyltransferase involved in cell wall biosynthesis
MSGPQALKPAEGGEEWVIVCGGFNVHGGMDKANLAVAEYLLDEREAWVHLVGHEIDPGLAAHPRACAYPVPRPRGMVALAEWMLDRMGRRVARRVTAANGAARVMVNGGNCEWFDINWVHYVHHAWSPADGAAPLPVRFNNRRLARLARRHERERVPRARIVLSNSHQTSHHLEAHLGIDPARIQTVYLGSEPSWGPATDGDREAGRARFDQPSDRPLVVFVGALGYDDRKGFDTLLEAWRQLSASEDWDVDLLAAGGGRGLEGRRAAVRKLGLEDRVRLPGFVRGIPELLAAADLLVSPARYEPYGLNVQEALCRGLPAMVSATAGIAERYPPEAADLIIRDPDDPAELARLLLCWRSDAERLKQAVNPLAERLRAYTWREMARDLVAVVSTPPMNVDPTAGR